MLDEKGFPVYPQTLDKNGIPIYPGDLIKSYHFMDRRKRKHYLYHTAVYRNEKLMVVPTCHLDPSHAESGGVCSINQLYQPEIIHGVHVEDDPTRANFSRVVLWYERVKYGKRKPCPESG